VIELDTKMRNQIQIEINDKNKSANHAGWTILALKVGHPRVKDAAIGAGTEW